MSPLTRLAAHLVVIGTALVTAAVRPASATTTPPAGVAFSTPRVVVARVAEPLRPRTRRAAPTRHRRARAHARPATPALTGPTSWRSLDAAIARIPSYRPGTSRWVVSSRYGHWGTADWYHDTLYISPSVPPGYLYDVAVHEWSHELSV